MILTPTPRGIRTAYATQAFTLGPVLLNQARSYAFLMALVLAAAAAWSFASAWPIRVLDPQALETATRRVGFAVGHASAVVGFDGLGSHCRSTRRVRSKARRSARIPGHVECRKGSSGATSPTRTSMA